MAPSWSDARSARRPYAVTGLSLFFAFGAGISALSLVALLWPGGVLEPIWQLNPRAREHFTNMGSWALLLMGVVSLLCALTAIGLWSGRRYGFILGLAMLAVSLIGDLTNAVLGVEPRAWVGVPIAALLIAALSSRGSRAYFAKRDY